jgi:ParB-like chromosome segregation protein Spo0J
MTMILDAHKITELFPEMTSEEYAALKQDIERNGLQEAIWIHGGKIVDGRSRYRACVELGIEPQLREWDGTGSLLNFVVSANLHRRHLTASQKAMLAVQIEKQLSVAAKQNMRAAGGDRRSVMAVTPFQKVEKPIHAAKQAAAIVGANTDYVVNAKKVEEQAPDLVPAVVSGTINVRDARHLSKLSRRSREAVVEKIVTGEAKNVKEARKMVKSEEVNAVTIDMTNSSKRYHLLHKSIEEIADRVRPDSFDSIICDPPYLREFLHVYEPLARLAARGLKPGGSLLVMIGHVYLPEILATMTPHVSFQWICNYDMLSGAKSQVWARRVISTWKPVLWFVKGEYKGEFRYDRFKSGAPDKDYHEWGQSLDGMEDIIRRYTKPGDLILDPFVGGGTTGIAALKLKRRFVGVDSDEQAVRTSKMRIEEYLREEVIKAA